MEIRVRRETGTVEWRWNVTETGKGSARNLFGSNRKGPLTMAKLIETTSRQAANRTASLVVSTGVSWDGPKTHEDSQDSDLPLPVMIPEPWVFRSGLPDLTGKRRGRLVVVGFSATVPKRWVCRCDCGKFTLRKTRSISIEEFDACYECCRVIWIRDHKSFDPTAIKATSSNQ